MLCIDNRHTDPYFNIAAEEYLLKKSQGDVFMLYRNEPSVIIGKHQDVWAETNVAYAERHNIKIVRRFSGGGAVFHDLGNLNLAFIEENGNPDFEKYTKMMIEMLGFLGVYAKPDKRRSLTIDGLKISGSAQAIYKNRILYHSTLLFSSDLTALTASLKGTMHIQDKTYVASVKSEVANISDCIYDPVDMNSFVRLVSEYFVNKYGGSALYEFLAKDITEIENLKNNKYATREWNFNACVADHNNLKAG